MLAASKDLTLNFFIMLNLIYSVSIVILALILDYNKCKRTEREIEAQAFRFTTLNPNK